MMLVMTSRDAFEGVAFVSIGTGVLTGVSTFVGAFFVGSCAAYAALCVGWRLAKGSDAWVARPGFCTKCGYSLAGLLVPVCPECGALRPVLRERDALSNVQEHRE
jgi:hypothetical protein